MLNPTQFGQYGLSQYIEAHESGGTDTVYLKGESTPRRVWKGHPTERPEGWVQAELPR
jgi:hypothetical protein